MIDASASGLIVPVGIIHGICFGTDMDYWVLPRLASYMVFVSALIWIYWVLPRLASYIVFVSALIWITEFSPSWHHTWYVFRHWYGLLSSPPVFSGVRAAQSLVFCVMFVDRCLFFLSLYCLSFDLVFSNFSLALNKNADIYFLWMRPLWNKIHHERSVKRLESQSNSLISTNEQQSMH